MRVHVIGHRTLFPLNTKTTSEEEDRREQRQRNEFIKAVPSASRLQGSVLVTHRAHVASGAELHFSLAERPAPRPASCMGIPEVELPAAGESQDPFEQDVENVALECANVETRLTLALNPSLTPEQLKQKSLEAQDIKGLRRLFGKRRRALILPTPTGDRRIDLEPRPAHLPVAWIVDVVARVENMPPGELTLFAAYVSTDHTGKQWDHSSRNFPLEENIAARRPSSLPADQLTSLVHLMDSRTHARLRVKLSFDWVDGEVSSVEILLVL